jgi:hypothetical protein
MSGEDKPVLSSFELAAWGSRREKLEDLVTLFSSGEDVKNTPVLSGEDVKNTLVLSGEDVINHSFRVGKM